MTFGSVMEWSGYGRTPAAPSIDRFHHGSHGHGGYKSRGSKGGHGAALSALTLLAFLFLLNVLQQSLQNNNATGTRTASTTQSREIRHESSAPVKADENGTNSLRQNAGLSESSISAHKGDSSADFHKRDYK